MNNTDATEELTDATDEPTDAIEENTDLIQDQVDEIQFGAVEFNKYTSSIQKALFNKDFTGLQERGKREQERLDELLLILKNQIP